MPTILSCSQGCSSICLREHTAHLTGCAYLSSLSPPQLPAPCASCEHYMLIAAMNPCPCGYYGDPVNQFTCNNATKYQKRISGPLRDRIDIHIEVPRLEFEKISRQRLGKRTEVIYARVEAARQIQRARFMAEAAGEKETSAIYPSHLRDSLPQTIHCNAEVRLAEVCL